MSDPAKAAALVAACTDPRRRHVYVIPAFETRCNGPSFADGVAVHGKERLQAEVAGGCVGQMRGKVAAPCHNATRYERWFGAGEPYATTYELSFEPWFIADRRAVPW